MERIDTKLAIHVGVEVLIIGGVSFYFHKKMKKLEERLENLEKQNDFYRKAFETHETYIKEMCETLQSRKSTHLKEKISQPVVNTPVDQTLETRVVTSLENTNITIDNFKDTDLDAELADEYKELTEN